MEELPSDYEMPEEFIPKLIAHPAKTEEKITSLFTII